LGGRGGADRGEATGGGGREVRPPGILTTNQGVNALKRVVSMKGSRAEAARKRRKKELAGEGAGAWAVDETIR